MGAEVRKVRRYRVARAEEMGRALPSRAPEPARVPELAGSPVLGQVHDPAEAEATRLASTALSVARAWGGADGGRGVPARRSVSVASDRLDPVTESRLSAGFGRDLSGVRVHTGPGAQRLAEGLGARAFSHGSDLYFGAGEYAPGSREGDEVLAHEVAHAVQASDSGSASAPSVVRRFPKTAAQRGPVDWQRLTGQVDRPGEGVSGGVFILTSNQANPGVKTVVVKPVFGKNNAGIAESGTQMVFGDRVLTNLFNIKTPTSRVVTKGTPEFVDLVNACSPKYQLPANPAQAAAWRPLTDAESFVVMSEVPEAKSVGSLADKAATDRAAAKTLEDALFDYFFLFDLGKLCIGDMLIGNNDRMVARAMNIGNLMISKKVGEPWLWAIDTNAFLGEFDPQGIVGSGSASDPLQGGWSSTRQTFEDTPEGILDGFMEIVAQRVELATPKPPQGGGSTISASTSSSSRSTNQVSPADALRANYKEQRDDFCLLAFKDGWKEGLDIVRDLVEKKAGRLQMRHLTGDVAGQQGADKVSYGALKVNAMYLAARSKGVTHKEAATPAGSYAAYKVLETFDPSSILPPQDEFHPGQAQVPGGVESAALERINALPAPGTISQVVPLRQLYSYDRAELGKIGAAVAQAKAEVDQIGGDGTKTRGILTPTTRLRNRVVAGRFIAETYLLGGGAIRAAASLPKLKALQETLGVAIAADAKQSWAARAKPAASALERCTPDLRTQLEQYKLQLRNAAAQVRKLRRYERRDDLATRLEKIEEYIDKGIERFKLNTDPILLNPRLVVNAIDSASK